jgi:peroxiredoxin Q/BCP
VWTASLDSVKELAAFAEKQELPFGLLSDPDGSVATKYGVLDPSGKYAQRVTFVLDETGKVRAIDDQVDVKNHGMDLAERVTILKEE